MKSLLKYFIGFLLFIEHISLYGQSISFTPQNGQTIQCPGTRSNADVNFTWSWNLTPYPPHVTIAAYAKLITENGTYENNIQYSGRGSDIPQWFTLGPNEYTWTIELYELYLGENNYIKTASQTNTFYIKYRIYASNSFNGGIIELEGNNVNSGSSVLKMDGENVSVGAIDQNDGNSYYRIWNTNGTNNSYWLRGASQLSSSRYYSHYVANNDNGITLIADLKKVCGLTFQANSSMSINGNYRTSPYTESVVEQNSISALASSYSANGIDFTFSKWSTSSGDVYSPITASEHKTYTAVYTGKPSSSECSITFNTSQEGQPVNLTWSKHPLDNSSISHYAIWRKVTTSGTPTLLTTVSATGASSYSFTDYEYAISSGANKILLFYDVRPYYSPDNSYSDPSFDAVYGFYNINKQPDDIAQNQTSLELPTSLSVSNYPNPFNPTTTISYQLPEKSFVTLKVFDILGKEVATLVNETKSAGYHTVIFDAGHSERGRGMTSGVYIYTLSANGIVQTKKMLLTK